MASHWSPLLAGASELSALRSQFAARIVAAAESAAALWAEAGLAIWGGHLALSSTGIFGAALLFGFILHLYILRCPAEDPRTKEFAIALKFALAPYFAMMAVAGSTPDFGFEAASVMGLLARLTTPETGQSPSRVPGAARQAHS